MSALCARAAAASLPSKRSAPQPARIRSALVRATTSLSGPTARTGAASRRPPARGGRALPRGLGDDGGPGGRGGDGGDRHRQGRQGGRGEREGGGLGGGRTGRSRDEDGPADEQGADGEPGHQSCAT